MRGHIISPWRAEARRAAVARPAVRNTNDSRLLDLDGGASARGCVVLRSASRPRPHGLGAAGVSGGTANRAELSLWQAGFGSFSSWHSFELWPKLQNELGWASQPYLVSASWSSSKHG